METKLSILVLSCDAYSDLWDDFFNLRDKYWNETSISWYLVTESKKYYRKNVNVINCGYELNWTGRLRHAVTTINTQYIGVFLEDYFITDYVDTDRIYNLLIEMHDSGVTYLNLGDVFNSIIGMKDKTYFKEGLIVIPQHKKYGISAAAAIWDCSFLLEKLGADDYSAWQFEIERCKEAASLQGLGGFLLCDEQKSFNVSELPVVIQGKFYPKTIRYFKNRGYSINTSTRGMMSLKQVILYQLKTKCASISICRKQIKWVAEHVLKIKFFTKE